MTTPLTRRTTAALATIITLLAVAATAHAGTWIQVSCVNPNGTAAPSEGWTTLEVGGGAPIANLQCGPGTPMLAEMSAVEAAPANSTVGLYYTPPAGSSLVGGTVDTTLQATGSGPGLDSTGFAGLYEPNFSSSFYECDAVPYPCGTDDAFSGVRALPSDRGGDFGIAAGCASNNGTACSDEGYGEPTGTPWAEAQLAWAQFALSSSVSPTGAGFSGSALARRVRGTAHLVFTAAEPAGPGIYQVSVAVAGRTRWVGTPNTNGGECAPVGSSGSALMFDYQQPCLTTEVVDVPVPTGGLSDGSHELAVTVTDAAGNSATVLDQTITTSNPQTTPKPRGRGALHARFVISWSWSGATTRLRSISVADLPRASGVSVTCTGRRCPSLTVRHVNAPQVSAILRSLGGRRFHAGDVLHVTVSERHHRPERILLAIRSGREPGARLAG